MPPETSRSVPQSIGPYDLLEKVAEGGMGAIYRGRNRDTGEIVAVKIMAPHVANNKVLLKRFEQEFRAASRLDHPNIVRALDYGEANSAPYLVMEFVEGESLGARIERDGRLPEDEAIRLIAQVAQALNKAHKQGLIHRDVKPDNILVTRDGQAKLADLGLVKETEADLNLTRTGRGLGTPHFMAPEQFRNAKNATPQCDIYSLGATLYQMVTGELPFRGTGPLDAFMKKIQGDLTPPRKVAPDISERIDWAIRRAMSADPDQRPSNCREFIEDLTGHTTRRLPAAESSTGADVWYMVYKDDEGEVHTVKGSTAAIRRSLRDGVLGDASNVRASRAKAGPFEPLRGFPEFRDMVVAPSATNTPAVTPTATTPAGGVPVPPRPPKAETTVHKHAPATMPSPPRIDLAPLPGGNPPTLEWLKWLGVIAVALASAGLAYYLLR
jgi:serine/threonine protein kinase